MHTQAVYLLAFCLLLLVSCDTMIPEHDLQAHPGKVLSASSYSEAGPPEPESRPILLFVNGGASEREPEIVKATIGYTTAQGLVTIEVGLPWTEVVHLAAGRMAHLNVNAPTARGAMHIGIYQQLTRQLVTRSTTAGATRVSVSTPIQ